MKSENYLEKLMIDHSFNELPPETVWILEEYLADHPQYRQELQAWSETVQIAKQASQGSSVPDRPLPSMPDLWPKSNWRWPRFILWPALCILFLGVGWYWRQESIRAVPSEPKAIVIATSEQTVSPKPLPRLSENIRNSEKMRSLYRWKTEAESKQTRKTSTPLIQWHSPFRPEWKGEIR